VKERKIFKEEGGNRNIERDFNNDQSSPVIEGWKRKKEDPHRDKKSDRRRNNEGEKRG